MAEAAGVAVGIVSLAGLFNSCLHVFSLIELGRARSHDYKILHQKLDNQKFRFMTWGQANGLDGGLSYDERLDEPERRQHLARTMELVHSLFKESDGLTEIYGLQQKTSHGSSLRERNSRRDLFWQALRKLQIRRSRTSTDSIMNGTNMRWAIADRSRFEELIKHLKDLIDDLESLTILLNAPARQKDIAAKEFEAIRNPKRLQLIVRAEEGQSSIISDAASSRIQSLGARSRFSFRSRTSENVSTEQSFITAKSHLEPESLDMVASVNGAPTIASTKPQNQRLMSLAQRPQTGVGEPETITPSVPRHARSWTSSCLKPHWAKGRAELFHAIRARHYIADWEFSLGNVPVSYLQDPTKLRLCRDLQDLRLVNTKHSATSNSIVAEPINGDLGSMLCALLGPADTPCCGGIFYLHLSFGPRYPVEPPKAHFITKIYHPNIDSRGKICLDVLGSRWTSTYCIETILISILSLLGDPNTEDPLVPEIAETYETNRELYEHNALLYTERYATGERPSQEELLRVIENEI